MTPQDTIKGLRAALQNARKKIAHQAQEINRLTLALAQAKTAASKPTRPSLWQRIGERLRRSGK